MDEELLPEIDRDFLEEKEFSFELIPFPAGLYLIIKNYEFPDAYTPKNANVLIVVPSGYPNAPIDMFFTIPDVKRVDGNWPIACEAHVKHNNILWQQWSRHIAWRIGVDNLRTYFSAIKKELAKGI